MCILYIFFHLHILFTEKLRKDFHHLIFILEIVWSAACVSEAARTALFKLETPDKS